MGVSHYWFSCFVDDVQYSKILPLFKKAEISAVLSKESQAGIEFWKNNQNKVNWVSQDGEYWNYFLCAFDLPGYLELATSFCQTNGMFSDLLTGENVHRFILINRLTPVSILWFVLGYENSSKLPGKMGNLLLHSTEVGDNLKNIKSIIAGTKQAEFISKAKLYSGLELDDKSILEIITMLTDGLENALAKRKGIIFLARPQL